MSLLTDPTTVCFTVHGKATPKGSMTGYAGAPRADGSIAVHLVDKAKGLSAWSLSTKWAGKLEMKRVGLELLTGPVRLEVTFWLARPKRPKNHYYPVTKPDLDKLTRAVGDALTGIVWVDDNQVVELIILKRYASTEFVGASIKVTCLQ